MVAAAIPAFLASVASCGKAATPELSAPPSRPNVLLISLDSLRPDHLGCYGYRSRTGAPTSPNLDRLASEGVLFERAVSTTSWTMPSHHALFSGLVDLLHGAISNDTGPTPIRRQLAATLRESGYATAGFFSGPYLAPRYGFGGGFDHYENVAGVREDVALSEVEVGYERASSARRVSDAGIAWLEEHGRSRSRDRAGDRAAQPFFLFLHYFDVHYDYVPPEEGYARGFWPDGRRPPIDGSSFFGRPDVKAGMSEDELAGVISYYDGEILWTDEQVGRVLDRLASLELSGETLVVVVSDHGDEFFEHGAKGHRQNLFEPTLAVALIARLPGRLAAGKRIAQRVSLVDVAPTILDFAGELELERASARGRVDDRLDVPALEHGMWGRTLLPLVDGEERADRDCLGFLTNRWQDPERPVDTWSLWTGSMKVLVSKEYEWIRNEAREPIGLRTVARSGRVFDLLRDPGEHSPLEPSGRADVEAAIERFDATFAPDGNLARLMRLLPAGSAATFESEAERAAEEAQLRQLGYTEGPSGSLPPPPQFPRAR